MRKVSMNEQQFERFITENAIRVAQRYLMETIDGGADIEEEDNPELPSDWKETPFKGTFEDEDGALYMPDDYEDEDGELDYGPEDYDDPDYQIPRF